MTKIDYTPKLLKPAHIAAHQESAKTTVSPWSDGSMDAMSSFHPLRDGGKEVGELTFEWDINKEKINIEKHGINFTEAAETFAGRVLIADDEAHSTPQEARFHALGQADGEHILLIVHCIRGAGNVIRIISARRADRDEREVYRKATSND